MNRVWPAIAGLGLGLAFLANTAPPDSGKTLTCSQCHRTTAAHVGETGMSNALLTGERSEILKSHPKLVFRQGPFSYTIERRGNQSWYTVTDGKNEISVPIDWAFGLGAAGQTYVFRRGNVWNESRVSYYREIDSLDLTVGARPEVPGSLEEALGRWLSVRSAIECFDCHSTGALRDGALQTESLTPGVHCQRCHEGAELHMAGFQRPDAAKVTPPKLSQLSTEDLSDFCGQCHRTWSQIASDGPHNVNNVRFQPYRLTNSKCYDSTDTRIRCTTCHDPHTEVVHNATFYDSRCLACHSGTAGAKPGAKVCKIGSQNCASCHLPKIRISESHNAFTDHWIRIVRPGQAYPN